MAWLGVPSSFDGFLSNELIAKKIHKDVYGKIPGKALPFSFSAIHTHPPILPRVFSSHLESSIMNLFQMFANDSANELSLFSLSINSIFYISIQLSFSTNKSY